MHIIKHIHEYDVWMLLKNNNQITDCGKESGRRRGGSSGHSTGDKSNTIDVSCSKILFNGHIQGR